MEQLIRKQKNLCRELRKNALEREIRIIYESLSGFNDIEVIYSYNEVFPMRYPKMYLEGRPLEDCFSSEEFCNFILQHCSRDSPELINLIVKKKDLNVDFRQLFIIESRMKNFVSFKSSSPCKVSVAITNISL